MILSRDGWVKRVREIKDISATRLREGDAVLTVLRGSTKEAIASSRTSGSCYVMRVNDMPASTGYGEPVQKLFKFTRRRARSSAAMLLDAASAPAGAVALARSRAGLRPALQPGRRTASCRPAPAGASRGRPRATRSSASPSPAPTTSSASSPPTARALVCKADEIPELANPGRGVTVIKVDDDDAVVGFGVGRARDKESLTPRPTAARRFPMGTGPSVADRRAVASGHALARKAQGRARDPARAAATRPRC